VSAAVKLESTPAPAEASERRSIYPLTVDQYHRMITEGILTAKDRVELIEGVLVQKMSRNPPHDEALARIMRRLVRLLPEEWTLRGQSAVTLRRSEPEPDFAIARGPEGTYSRRKPGPRDIALVIEVADSSLLADRNEQAILYADARIPEYWIVNLVNRRVEVYSDPKGGRSPGYRQRRDYGANESVPLVLDGREVGRIPVRGLLP
jgi:Uma2 family endonuclease